MLKLYENIKKRRTELNISQQELAELVGYKGKSMISQVESGLIDLPQSMILKFADALNCSASDLMGWEDGWAGEVKEDAPVYTVSDLKGVVLSDDERRLIDKLHRTGKSRDDIEYILKMLSLPADSLEFVYNQIDFQLDWIEKEKRKKDSSSFA